MDVALPLNSVVVQMPAQFAALLILGLENKGLALKTSNSLDSRFVEKFRNLSFSSTT